MLPRLRQNLGWLLLALPWPLAGCGPPGPTVSLPSTTTAKPKAAAEAPIRVASFNLHGFGVQKLQDTLVTDTLTRIITRFDVIAIQEVHCPDQTVLSQLVARVNSLGYDYGYVLGPRLGSSESKEQYGYIFDHRRIDIDRNWIYTFRDQRNLLQREPLIARFFTRSTEGSDPFSFLLVNLHTDPNRLEDELAMLDELFLVVQQNGSGEDDVILLGDLNSSPTQLRQAGLPPYLRWTVSEQPTNTRGTRAYDNLIVDQRFTGEFTGRSGVFDFRSAFELTLPQALRVSDHLPVWAEFHPVEAASPTNVATRTGKRYRIR